LEYIKVLEQEILGETRKFPYLMLELQPQTKEKTFNAIAKDLTIYMEYVCWPRPDPLMIERVETQVDSNLQPFYIQATTPPQSDQEQNTNPTATESTEST
jgi:hypothetical protein